MRYALGFCAAIALGLVLLSGTDAGEKKGKEVTLKGTITCNKCDLGKTTECETVLVVKKDNKDMVLIFDAAAHKKHHAAVCTEAKPGTVVGTISGEGDKKTITVKSLKFD